MRNLYIQLLVSILVLGGCSQESAAPEAEPVAASPQEKETYANGMVSSAHPLATEAGLEILALAAMLPTLAAPFWRGACGSTS